MNKQILFPVYSLKFTSDPKVIHSGFHLLITGFQLIYVKTALLKTNLYLKNKNSVIC